MSISTTKKDMTFPSNMKGLKVILKVITIKGLYLVFALLKRSNGFFLPKNYFNFL